MLVEQEGTRHTVRRIVFNITTNQGLHDDLAQEAFVHLWLRETERPGQTESWYFQSCRFHLQNYLRCGRSVDSNRRYTNLCVSAELVADPDLCSEQDGAASDSVVDQVSAREITALLEKSLTPLQRQVLECLAAGASVRETAARLKITHTSVMRYRRRIASLAMRLGIEPPPGLNGQARALAPGSS